MLPDAVILSLRDLVPNIIRVPRVFPPVKHRSTRDAVEDLRKGGFLIQIDEEVDAHLEMAEIQRRVYANNGPALLFTNIRGLPFPSRLEFVRVD